VCSSDLKLYEILDASNLKPVSPPIVDPFEFKEGQDLAVKATFDYVPDFEIPPLESLELTKYVSNVTEEMIDTRIEMIRQNLANFTEAEQDHTVAIGDVLEVNFRIVGDSDAEANPKEELQNAKFVIKDDKSEFSKSLIGHVIHDKLKIPVEEKEPDPNKEKKFYDLSIEKILLPVLPNLDDEMAKDLAIDNVNDLPSLREHLRDAIFKHQESESRKFLDRQIIKKLSKELTLNIPESIIEEETDRQIANYKASYDEQPNAETSEKLDDWLKNESLRKNFRGNALRYLKMSYIFQKIAGDNNFSVSKEEIEKQKSLLISNNDHKQDLNSFLKSEEYVKYFENNILVEKVYEFILSKAKVTEVKRESFSASSDVDYESVAEDFGFLPEDSENTLSSAE
jgi:trigger factor